MKQSNESTAEGVRRPAGIKDIAQALGVSIGTVDRALHGRPGINPVTQKRVLKMAQTLGYRPNIVARNLKLRRKLRIAVQLPREIAAFFDALREGIREAAAPFESSVELVFFDVPRLGEQETEAFQLALNEGVSGIIVAPGHPQDLKALIRKAALSRVPVVCVATDAPKTERLTAVSSDPYISGAIVAELFLRTVPQTGSVLAVTGDLSTYDHAEKLRGFEQFLATGAQLALGAVIQAHDDPAEAYERVSQELRNRSDIRAVYVGTANSLPAIRALKDAGRLREVTMITTDLVPGLAPLIRNGEVLATVHQRPVTQGRMAFQALHLFLTHSIVPPARLTLAPHIVLRSNLKFFLERHPVSLEGPDRHSKCVIYD